MASGVAWKAYLETHSGKQRAKTVVVYNISNHDAINAIHPKFCIGIFSRCLALFNILMRNRYAEERRGLPQNSFIPVVEERNYFLPEDLICAVKWSRIYFVTLIKFP